MEVPELQKFRDKMAAIIIQSGSHQNEYTKAFAIISLLDSPDSPYVLKSEVVKRIREIENPYSKDIGEKAMEIRSWFAYNEALQKAVELFEEVQK